VAPRLSAVIRPSCEVDALIVENQAESRGEPVQTVTMTGEEFERWMVDGPDDPFKKESE